MVLCWLLTQAYTVRNSLRGSTLRSPSINFWMSFLDHFARDGTGVHPPPSLLGKRMSCKRAVDRDTRPPR